MDLLDKEEKSCPRYFLVSNITTLYIIIPNKKNFGVWVKLNKVREASYLVNLEYIRRNPSQFIEVTPEELVLMYG